MSFSILFISLGTYYDSICSLVIELSDDCKNVRCKVCGTLRGKNDGWIRKESLAYHLKSEAHAYSVRSQQDRERIEMAREESMREESSTEEGMDFAILSSAIRPVTTVEAGLPLTSLEEEEMWQNYAFSKEIFNAGVDHKVAAAQQRRQLEKEANNFSLWCDVDCLPEDYSINNERLLDELEQEDILTELLQSTHGFIFLSVSFKK